MLELQYLPCIQYVSKMLLHPVIWIEQCENYSKGSYRNRCHIATAQGLLRLSIPLEGGKHQQQPIREVRIANQYPWQSQHWQAIQSAYGKSPFFEFYADALFPFYKKKYEFLWDWNRDLLNEILHLIPAQPPIQWTEGYEKNLPENILDYRNQISPKKNGHEADPYFRNAHYAQVFEEKHGFLPNLSILDLLFCTGPESIIYLEKSLVRVPSTE